MKSYVESGLIPGVCGVWCGSTYILKLYMHMHGFSEANLAFLDCTSES